MPYVTVFDIMEQWTPWWFPASGLIFVAVGVGMIAVGRLQSTRKSLKTFGYAFAGFAVLWMLVAAPMIYMGHRAATRAYQAGDYKVVEGAVENFDPMPYAGHRDERFSVAGVRFHYSDYVIAPGFRHTASHGGPVRAGQPVRIAYRGNTILRLEIRADSLPPSVERDQRAKAERQKFDAAVRSIHPQLTLGFVFAMAVVTLCWNLDWRHYLRHWVRWVPPPYGPYKEWGFRGIALFLFVQSVVALINDIRSHQRSASDYGWAALYGFGAIGLFLLRDGFIRWRLRRKPASATDPD